MSEAPTRNPLAWPEHRKRTPPLRRKNGMFRYKDDDGWSHDITVAVAVARLEKEVARLGGVNALISSNVDIKRDGRPRSGAPKPVDPGVCLYFSLDGQPLAMACDAYTDVACNIAALAAHIEATRAIERHGVATAAETLQAFQALPPPVEAKPKVPWHKVFGVVEASADAEMIGTLYRVLAKRAAGDEAALRDLNVARDEALLAIRHRERAEGMVATSR